jgi:ParB family chromosome partitioning protein
MKVKQYSVDMPVAKIRKSPHHMRKESGELKIAELAESIKKHGLIHALSVVEDPDGEGYELTNGHRRLMAHKHAKLPIARVNIYEYEQAELDDESLRRQAVAEHLLAANSAEPLIPLERARYYADAMEQFDWEIEDLARVHNLTTAAIADDMLFLNLDPQVLDLAQAHTESFSEANLRVLAEYATPSAKKGWAMTPTEQIEVARELALQTDKKLVESPRALQAHIRTIVQKRRQDATKAKRKLGQGQDDPVKALFKLLEAVQKSVDELAKADFSSIKAIDPRDKGKATQDLFELAQQLIDIAENTVGDLKTRQPTTPVAA